MIYILNNMGEKVLEILHIDGSGAMFILLYDSKTQNLSNDKWKMVQMDQYSP